MQTAPASAESGPPPATVPAVPGTATLDFARLMITSGAWVQAIATLERITSLRPADPEGWFLLGLAYRGGGHEASAADAFRRASELAPGQPRPLLELGKSLTDLRQYEAARDAFMRALSLSDDRTVRRNIRRYLKVIDEQKTLTYWISAITQPDTNPSSASGLRNVSISGNQFKINQPPTSGTIGIGAQLGVRYAPWINETTRVITQLGYDGVHFFNACCSDEVLELHEGLGWNWGNSHFNTLAFARYRRYNNQAYSEQAGIRLDAGWQRPLYSIGVSGEAGPSRLLDPMTSGSVVIGALSGDIALTDSVSVGGTLRIERDAYPVPSQSFVAPWAEVRTAFFGPWNLPVNAWAGYLLRDYAGATLTSDGLRVDRLVSLGISVELDFVTIWSVSPTFGVSDQIQTSSDPLARFHRLQALFGISKMF